MDRRSDLPPSTTPFKLILAVLAILISIQIRSNPMITIYWLVVSIYWLVNTFSEKSKR